MKIPSVVLPYCDKNGKPLPTIGGLKIGDVVYRKIKDQLVAGTVTKLNPFTVQSK